MPGRATLAPTATCGESRSGDLRDEANQLSLSRAGPGMTTCDAVDRAGTLSAGRTISSGFP